MIHDVVFCMQTIHFCVPMVHFSAFVTIDRSFYIAPEVVIYDNGCNLHNYILNGEPHFFRTTRFLIDRFHWPNHVGEFS